MNLLKVAPVPLLICSVRNLQAIFIGRWAGIPEATSFPQPERQGRCRRPRAAPIGGIFISLYKLLQIFFCLNDMNHLSFDRNHFSFEVHRS